MRSGTRRRSGNYGNRQGHREQNRVAIVTRWLIQWWNHLLGGGLFIVPAIVVASPPLIGKYGTDGRAKWLAASWRIQHCSSRSSCAFNVTARLHHRLRRRLARVRFPTATIRQLFLFAYWKLNIRAEDLKHRDEPMLVQRISLAPFRLCGRRVHVERLGNPRSQFPVSCRTALLLFPYLCIMSW